MTEGEEEVPRGELGDDPDETIELAAQSQPVQAVHVIDSQSLGQPVGQPMQHATVVTTSGFQHQEILKGEEIHIPINGDNIAINELAKKGYQIRIASNGKKSTRWNHRTLTTR